MSSRKTSNVHDQLSVQDGWKDGKATQFNAPDVPELTQDYDVAASSANALTSAGGKRYGALLSENGKPARGTAANKYGWVTAQQFADAGYSTGGRMGDRYAAIVKPEPDGISIWRPILVSGDAFQWANRPSNSGSGLTDDGPDGFLWTEDKRNARFSIAMYERTGTIPATQVHKAYKDGLIDADIGSAYFDKDPAYASEKERIALDAQLAEEKRKVKAELAKATAEVEIAKTREEIDKLKQGVGQKGTDPKGRQVMELTVYDSGWSAWTAKTDAESRGADSPHPGVSVVGAGYWERYAGAGVAPQSLGLPKALLAWQEDTGEIRPATEEYESLKAASQDMDDPETAAYATDVLRSIGL